MLGVRRPLTILAAGVSALLAAFALTAAPAVAGTTDRQPAAAPAAVSYLYLQNYQSGLCVDASASQGVRLNTCNFSEYQRWRVSNDEWRHDRTGLCLDGSASQGVRLHTCNGGSYQDWAWDSFNVWNKTGLCLDGSVSQGVRMTACDPGNIYQWWSVRA